MLLIASAVLLDPLDLKFGEKASAKIQGINGIHYTIFKLTADEINIYRNTNDYTLLINAEALSSINIYICNHKDYLQCKNDPQTIQYTPADARKLIMLQNYTTRLSLDEPVFYIMVTASASDVQLNIRVDSAIIINYIAGNITVGPGGRVYLLLANCDLCPYKMSLTSSKTIQICVSSREQQERVVDLASCKTMHDSTSTGLFSIETDTLYTLYTVFNNNMENVTFMLAREQAYPLKGGTTHEIAVYNYEICYLNYQMDFGADYNGNFTLVQGIPDGGETQQPVKSILYRNDNKKIIGEVDTVISRFHAEAHMYIQIAALQSDASVWPFNDVQKPSIAKSVLQITADPALEEVPHNHLVPITGNFTVYNTRAPQDIPISMHGQLYKSIMMQSNQTLEFSVAQHLERNGDISKVDDKSGYQLLQVNDSSGGGLQAADNTIYFIKFQKPDAAAAFIMDYSYKLLGCVQARAMVRRDQERYFYVDILEYTQGQVVVRATDDISTVTILASPYYYLPNARDTGMMKDLMANVVGQGEATLLVDHSTMDQHDVLYIAVLCDRDEEVTITFIPRNTTTNMLVNGVEEEVRLKTDKKLNIISVQIPQTARSDEARNMPYYYSVVFQAFIPYNQTNRGCTVHFMSYEEPIEKVYGYISDNAPLSTFSVKIDLFQALEDNFIYIRANTTCNISLQIVAVAAYHLESGTNMAIDVPTNNTLMLFQREFIMGTHQHLSLAVSSQQPGVSMKIYICGIPRLLIYNSVVNERCRYIIDISSSGTPVEVAVDETILPEDPQYAYYTLFPAIANESAVITLGELDIHTVAENIRHTVVIEPTQQLYYTISSTYYEDMVYLEASQLNDTLICVSTKFQKHVGDGCLLTLDTEGSKMAQIGRSQQLYVILRSNANKRQQAQFQISFVNQISDKVAGTVTPSEMLQYVYTPKNTVDSIVICLASSISVYDDQIIGQELSGHKLGLYVNIDGIAGPEFHQFMQSQAGPNSIMIHPNALGPTSTIFITVRAYTITDFQLFVVQSKHLYGIEQNHYAHIKSDSQHPNNYDFVLFSSSQPTGLVLEECTISSGGKGYKAYLSYLHMPSVYNFVNSTEFTTREENKSNMLMAYMHAEAQQFNYYLTVTSALEDAEFIVYHMYPDIRPRLSDRTIRIAEINDHRLKIVIDIAQYSSNHVAYELYLFEEGQSALFNNQSACGMRRGLRANITITEDSGLCTILLQDPLPTDGRKYVLNIIACDQDNRELASAYEPRIVYDGMPIDNDAYKDDETDGPDFTWIAWTLAGISIAAAIASVIYFIIVRVKYRSATEQGRRTKKGGYQKVNKTDKKPQAGGDAKHGTDNLLIIENEDWR